MDANCALGVESSLASGLRRKSLLSRVQRPRPALQRPKMLPRGSSQEYASTIGHHSHDKGLSAFIRFTRPHTILGTTISVCSMTFVGAVKSNLMHVLSVLGQALVPALLMNIAIVGLNQVYDKRIDMVNKPYLPLASGEFSSNRALLLISFTSAGSMIWGAMCRSNALMLTLIVSLLLGVLYSVDYKLLRWKKFPVLAATCIILVRAFTVHIGFFLHASVPAIESNSLSTISIIVLIMSVYSVVISLFKDLPDTSGDSLYGINTIGVRFGVSCSYNFGSCH